MNEPERTTHDATAYLFHCALLGIAEMSLCLGRSPSEPLYHLVLLLQLCIQPGLHWISWCHQMTEGS